MKTLTLKEAAAFLKIHAESLRQRVKAGSFPAARFGKAYVFLEEDLIQAVRCTYSQKAISAITQPKEFSSSWLFTSAIKSGGLTSRYQAVSALDEQLRQPTKTKPSTTSIS
jgi:excisionase family DNA binding protein